MTDISNANNDVASFNEDAPLINNAKRVPFVKWASILNTKNKVSSGSVLAALGAVGVGLSNKEAALSFPWLEALPFPFNKIIAWAFGICSVIINLIVNLEAFRAFSQDYKERDDLWAGGKDSEGNKISGKGSWVWYYMKLTAYFIVGLLFGVSAYALSLAGGESLFATIMGIFVAIATPIPECAAVLENYYTTVRFKFTSLREDLAAIPRDVKKYFVKNFGSFKSKISIINEAGEEVVAYIGFIPYLTSNLIPSFLAFMNVWGLNLLFALGLITLFCSFMNPVTAFIVGLSVASFFGYVTEQPFYRNTISNIVSKLTDNWHWIKNHKPELSIILALAAANAIINACACYVGLNSFAALMLTTISFALPPVALTILATSIAVFIGVASFIVCTNFWIGWRKNNPGYNPDYNKGNGVSKQSDNNQGSIPTMTNDVNASTTSVAIPTKANGDDSKQSSDNQGSATPSETNGHNISEVEPLLSGSGSNNQTNAGIVHDGRSITTSSMGTTSTVTNRNLTNHGLENSVLAELLASRSGIFTNTNSHIPRNSNTPNTSFNASTIMSPAPQITVTR